MLKDLNHLMSCSQDNYIREDNFLQVNVDLSFSYPHMRSTSFIPKNKFHVLMQEESRTNTQFKDNFSENYIWVSFSSHLLLEYPIFHQMNEINCQ